MEKEIVMAKKETDTVEELRARLARYREWAREIAADLPPLTEEQLRTISEVIHGVHLTPSGEINH